jgi:membrane protease YdiL (CAAX protease family)
MPPIPTEILVAYFLFLAFWIGLISTILIAARWSPRARGWRDQLLAQWKPALAIAIASYLSSLVSGKGWLTPQPIGVFCQALVGLALARSIAGYEPLPVVRSLWRREWRGLVRLALMAFIALLLVLPIQISGAIGMNLGHALFHESNFTREAQDSMPYNVWQVFFAFLAGAGIAEEIVYRLVAVSLVWRVTQSPWLGIIVGAVLFGAYHLSPLDGLYLTFLKFPMSQFLATVFIGIVLGIAYVKRGAETAIMAHTFSDWIPIAAFTLAAG